jgi:hypothetical protein
LYTKGHLFRCVKFILDKKTLDGLEGPRLIGKLVVNKLNIPEEKQVNFWNTYKGVVNQVLCEKQNNVNGAVKNSFIGKLDYLLRNCCIKRQLRCLLLLLPY